MTHNMKQDGNDLNEERLFDLKMEIDSKLQQAGLFGANRHLGATFSPGGFADLIDELIVIRIKQCLRAQKDNK